MMGIKDPNRYVVGNSLNSINPLTGQPEFFFKKIFKSIKKVFKKALPIIAPIVGNMLLPGIGGIIASGLVTKLQGGSWGDVLKSAAMSYGVSAIGSGLSGAFSSAPGATFMGGLTKGLAAPFKGISSLFGAGSGAASGVAGGIGGGAVYGPSAGGTLPSGFNSSGVAGGIGGGSVYGPSAASPIAPALADGMTASGDFGDFSGSLSDIGGTDLSPGYDALGPTAGAVKLQTLPELQAAFAANTEGPYNINNEFVSSNLSTGATPPDAGGVAPQEVLQAASEDGKGLFGDTLDYLGNRLDPSPEAASAARIKAFNADYDLQVAENIGRKITPPTRDAYAATWDKLNPPKGVIGRYMPAVATGAAALGLAGLATGAFTEEEEAFNAKPNKSEIEITAYDKWREVSDKNSPEAQGYFNTWNGPAYITRSQYEKQTGGPSIWQDWRFLPEGSGSNTGYDQTMGQSVGLLPADFRVSGAAMGGEVVGPGTGTSDSIPARLSDGEFVMTANAVQNAGGGNRDLGAARMYDMMRRFEGGVA